MDDEYKQTPQEEIISSWICGNQNWVREKVKDRSKAWLMELIETYAQMNGGMEDGYRTAVKEVRRMVTI